MGAVVKRVLIILVVVMCMLATAAATHSLANHYLDRKATLATPKCTQTGKLHKVVITEGKAQPEHTTAKLCDVLTIVNHDDQIRLMAFGIHEDHQAYDGVVEKALQKGQGLTITLNKTGTYRFHDHLDDSAQGTFTVNDN